MPDFSMTHLKGKKNNFQMEEEKEEDFFNLEAFLNSPLLADWAHTWLKKMQDQFGPLFRGLLWSGLGEKHQVPRWLRQGSPDAIWLKRFLRSGEATRLWLEQGFLQDDPAWLEHLLNCETSKVARSFLLSGNINDYLFDPTRGYRPTLRLLVDTFMRHKDCVLTFRLSQGLCVHSHDPNICNRLPNDILRIIETPRYNEREGGSLLAEVCNVFDAIRRWLTGGATRDENQCAHEFSKGVAIIFENVQLIIPSQPGEMERNFLVDNLLQWSNSPELFQSTHCLLLMAESLDDVSNELRARGGKIEQITSSRPDSVKARLKFLFPLLDQSSDMQETRVAKFAEGLAGLDGYKGNHMERVEQLSHDTAGLTLLGIEDLLQQAQLRPSRRLDRTTVMNLKRERLRQESDGLLEVLDPKLKLSDIGGYHSIKERIQEIINALIHASRDPLVRSTIPMGILFLGPPGTGKSLMAEAIASETQISMAKLGDFRGMYVGQSERNLSRIFGLIESLHPVIVFMDELDQAVGKRSGGSQESGVDSRIFGRFLEFMSNPDHRGKILWIGASNIPDKIDPALKRAGRFDLKLPFLLPDRSCRHDILKVLIHRKVSIIPELSNQLTEQDFEELAGLTEHFSGAELETIVAESLRLLARAKTRSATNVSFTIDLLKEVCAAYIIPPEQHEEYLKMERIAVKEVNFRYLLPERYTGGSRP